MEILEIELKKILAQSLPKGISYSEYTEFFREMVEKNSTSGNEKSKQFVEFTKLNQKRMQRWDKTLKFPEAIERRVREHNTKSTWVVLTETWCGDAAHTVPVINKLASLNEKIEVKLLLRDDHEDLMNEFLTNGGKSIPKLIALNADNEVIGTFGPRPETATKLVEDFKEKHGTLTPEFKEKLQVWYNKDKGQSAAEELVQLLEN